MATEILNQAQLMYKAIEPQRADRFVMSINGIPTFLIKQCEPPKTTNESYKVNQGQVYRKYKGKTDYPDVSITLIQAITPSAAQAVQEWLLQHHNPVTGQEGYSDMYKKDCTIKAYGPIGDVVQEWTLKGTFVVDCSQTEFSWDSGDPVNINVSLAYDYPILHY